MDFNQRPFSVIWETTRACDLACLHCRVEAKSERDSGELNFLEAQRLIGSVKAFGRPFPILVLTGGDPAKRPDKWRRRRRHCDSQSLLAGVTDDVKNVTREAVKRF